MRKRLGLKKCIFCKSRTGFKPISEGLAASLKIYKFLYSLSDFETLSYKNYECSVCSSSDRDRLYRLYLDKFQNFSKESKILDFAPSKLMNDYFRKKSSNYRTADLLIDGVDDKVDITNMKIYKDNSFDFFICSHVLEHVESDQKALSELRRVLKPSGSGILMTPIINKQGIHDEDPSITEESERWRRFAQNDHVRLYEKRVFLKRVKEAGFTIKAYGFKELGYKNFIENGITLKSKLYIVTKKDDE